MTFEGLTTIDDIDQCYKQAFRERNCVSDLDAYWELSSEHRLALESAVQELAKASGPKRYTMADVQVSATELRVWARENGIETGERGIINLKYEKAEKYSNRHRDIVNAAIHIILSERQ